MATLSHAPLIPIDLSNHELGRQRLKQVSLVTIYWCSNLRNAYWGSQSHLYSSRDSFHSTLESAKDRNEHNRVRGTRFLIEETPCLLLNLTIDRVCLIDIGNQGAPFCAPLPRKIKVKDDLGITFLTELNLTYELKILSIKRDTVLNPFFLPLKKYSSYVQSGCVYYTSRAHDSGLIGATYLFHRLGHAIRSEKSDEKPFIFSPYEETGRVCLP